MRVIISAYACEPGCGSEPGIGWNWVRQIAQTHEAWVLTRANNRPTIEAGLQRDPMPGVHWIYFDLPPRARFWKRGNRGIHLYYYLWQLGAYQVARHYQARVQFHIAHHVTFGKYWEPALLSALPIPFVWGPVGGGESAPGAFDSSFSWRGLAYEAARGVARTIAESDPLVRMTARRSSVALATTEETRNRLGRLGCRRVLVEPQMALSNEDIRTLGKWSVRMEDPFRVISVGRMLHWKGFELALRAFAQFSLRRANAEYWLIGDGPELANWSNLAVSLGIADRVRFWSAMPRAIVLQKLRDCDVLLHPSLHEAGGWVVLEAMAAARPVVCFDLGGPALQVTSESGVKIQAVSPAQAIDDIAKALWQLTDDPSLRRQFGLAARRRVAEHFRWEQKAAFINHIYDQVAERKNVRVCSPSAIHA